MFRKLFHIIISVLLVISTAGVTISKHYSGGKLYSFSISGEAQSCCEDDCECCQNSVDTYHLTADYLISTYPYQDNKTVIDLSDILIAVEQGTYPFAQYKPVSIIHYKLPLIIPDIQAWTQSFLL